MANPIRFGTDGWRAIIAEDFTFDNVRTCAQATADYISRTGQAKRGMVVGYDTRFASEDFAAAAAEVLAGNGIKTYLGTGPTPTPAVSYGVLAKKAAGAIVITASHNRAAWNGFKIKSADGSSAPPETTDQIEKNIDQVQKTGTVKRLALAQAVKKGLIAYTDLETPYAAQLARLVDLPGLAKARFKVVIDAMFGAGSGYLGRMLGGGDIELVEINHERNPLFPGMERPEPIEANLGHLSKTVTRTGARVGIATDGDADRVGIIDENGRFLTQLQVCALLALYLLETRGERGALVKTITMTSMLYRLGEIFGVPVFETPVGFKYVAPVMVAENALLGGEESGGYGFRGHVPERDGILAGLYFLDFMVKTGKTPSELLAYLYQKVGPHYYQRLDEEFPADQRPAIMRRLGAGPPGKIDNVKVERLDTTDGFRYLLADHSWLLIRFSGTEPVLRIYAEADRPERVARLLKAGKDLAGIL
ncbi:MAG: phosphoglucomutase/phosphomannomutase family protein [Chloroflexota bacterium]